MITQSRNPTRDITGQKYGTIQYNRKMERKGERRPISCSWQSLRHGDECLVVYTTTVLGLLQPLKHISLPLQLLFTIQLVDAFIQSDTSEL